MPDQHLWEWLDPKPFTYDTGKDWIIDFEGYLPEGSYQP